MTRRLLVPTTDRPVVFHQIGTAQIMSALIPEQPPTVGEMTERLSKGFPVLCRQSARGVLTSTLKRLGIWTRQKMINGQVLFKPCGRRAFK